MFVYIRIHNKWNLLFLLCVQNKNAQNKITTLQITQFDGLWIEILYFNTFLLIKQQQNKTKMKKSNNNLDIYEKLCIYICLYDDDDDACLKR